MDVQRSFHSNSYIPESEDSDPYSIMNLQELLQRNTDWINIQDIVKITLKAVLDTVKMQAEAIKDLEKALPTKASKSELNLGLLQKANISDMSRTIAEVAANMESKVSLEDMQELLKEKVSYVEFQRVTNEKLGADEIQMAMDTKVGIDVFKTEIKSINERLDEFMNSTSVQTTSRGKDLDKVKSDISTVLEELQQKASKESVANALKRKVNVADLEGALAHKVDVEDAESLPHSASSFSALTTLLNTSTANRAQTGCAKP